MTRVAGHEQSATAGSATSPRTKYASGSPSSWVATPAVPTRGLSPREALELLHDRSQQGPEPFAVALHRVAPEAKRQRGARRG
jgi:hypothetical protein